MRLAVFLVTMLTLVSFTGCLDGLTSEDIQEVKPGCTYAEAENYDPMAQIDDGSCIIKEPVAGCTYEDAENYNQLAEIDDGSCTFAEPVTGCMDPLALNYNKYAEFGDESCEYPIAGCTDEDATNYNSLAKKEDGSCEYPLEGCTDEDADNYNEDAEVDDGSCKYKGCTYEDAENYDESANADDGSCEYSDPVFGCTDSDAENYNEYATDDNGTCEYQSGDYESLTDEEINEFMNAFFNDDEVVDFTVFSDDFDRFGSSVSLNIMALIGDMFEDEGSDDEDSDDEGADDEDSDDEGSDDEDSDDEPPEDLILTFGVEKDDVNQILTATFAIGVGMEGMDMFGSGSEDGIVQMEMSTTSIRQGPNCTSSNCELTNDRSSIEMFMDGEGNGTEMSVAMNMIQTTYSRDEIPYYGNPIAELPGGGSFFFGMDEEPEVRIYRDDENITYDPVEIEVNIGDTIYWFNDDENVHTVTAEDGSFDSGDIDPNTEWEWTFEEEGTFTYYSDKIYDKGPNGEPQVWGEVTVIDPTFDYTWDVETSGLDTSGDGKDDWIVHLGTTWDEDANMTLYGTIRETFDGKLYPGEIVIVNETGATVLRFSFWYGDEVQIEIIDGEAEGYQRNSVRVNHDSEQYDDDTGAQNVFTGTINGNNEEDNPMQMPLSNYTQEVKNEEIEIRVLERYDGAGDDSPFGDPFGGDEEEGGINNATVVASMVLSDTYAEMEDPNTGCQWYIRWGDNDENGLLSSNDTYEIKSDKVDDEGEDCPRLDDEGNELYVIEFFDTWSDSYVESPNPGLQMPGFSAIFALIAMLGISLLRRRD